MDGEEKLTLCLRSDVHPHFNVRVKQKTPFSKVFQAFSQRYAAKPGCTFRYTLCDGTALGPDASPKTYGLEDEEIINVAEIPEGQPQGTQRVNQVNGTFREGARMDNYPNKITITFRKMVLVMVLQRFGILMFLKICRIMSVCNSV
eukprot:gb/GECG01008855.1/.p1 GENE.gb/GECG01008855.1/~~gb/GECG01008855.1/.p1  ORF type:complete len:146 (+),score=11.03 gb/GECG01008855.1/:1-438(+)